jgi:GAF domain-containing protein
VSASAEDRPAHAAPSTSFLHEIIATVGSTLELDEVLAAVVRLLSDASAVHACFVYLVDAPGERVVLRAASEPYGGLVGRIALERGEGLAWWVLDRAEPAFIRERALDDPRMKYVPELEEERFQSIVAIPLFTRDRSPSGVVLLHTEAPREFTDEEAGFLVSSASLVAGAIENARLYAELQVRVLTLERLTALGDAVAAAETIDALAPVVVTRARDLLRAESCQLYLAAPGTAELRLRSSTSPGARPSVPPASVGPEVAVGSRGTSLTAPLVEGGELIGLLTAEGTSDLELARAVASQAAVAIKKLDLIDRLTERNLIKDFFEQLAHRELRQGLEERAARLGCDLDDQYLVLQAAPADEGFAAALAGLAPAGSLVDRGEDGVRALVRITTTGAEALVRELRAAQARFPLVAVGASSPCSGAAAFAAGFDEARSALLGGSALRTEPGVTTFDELGAYKYLLQLPLDDEAARDPHRSALGRLADYDRARGTTLLRTLEEFLRRHGSIGATADALDIHANTLRQRLARIADVSQLDLEREDWLMVEIALKMVKLQQVLQGGAAADPRTG